MFTDSKSSELGLAILEAHDDEHGDVQEFKHKVVASGGDYRIESKEADEAALAEMGELLSDIGSSLGDFFIGTMGIKNPFAIIFGNDGLLSFDKGALTLQESQGVREVLKQINAYLTAERNGEETDGMCSPELTGIVEKFIKLKEVQDKIHDKSLLPQERVRFEL